MRVAVVHNAILTPPTPDEADTLVQRDAVLAALARLGHEAFSLSCDLDLRSLRESLAQSSPDVVFNLAEALDGRGRLIYLPAAVYESLGVPYTGASLEALFLTSHKVLAKERLRSRGLPTPDWIAADGQTGTTDGDDSWRGRFLVKSLWEDASIGLDDDSVVDVDRPEELRSILARKAQEPAAPWFAERYIEGRELNIALLAGPAGPEALAPAEILFEDYPEGKPRIVGYKAKWDEKAFEYAHTPRRLEFPGSDGPLLETLAGMSTACWHLFGLRGYGRVDFRVDREGRPWILEVNANPCLEPESGGFTAAVRKTGLSYEDAIDRIVRDAADPITG